MDEQQPGIIAVRRRSRAEADQLVADFEASGRNRVEFCQTHGLSLATLARYRKRRQAQGGAGAGALLAVELSGTQPGQRQPAGLAIGLPGGWRIEVERGFDGPTLVQVLRVLEQF